MSYSHMKESTSGSSPFLPHMSFSQSCPPLPWPTSLGRGAHKTRPYYDWLEKRIQYLIDSRSWQSGQRIPNEVDIAEATGLNIHTVKKAMLNLAEKGYLVRVKKCGTFVICHHDNRNQYRFYTLAKDVGSEKVVLHSHCEGLENKAVANEHLFEKFGCGPNFYKISRCIFVEQSPVLYTISWLDAELCPNFDSITLERLVYESLYSIMDNEYQIIIRRTQEHLSTVEASEEVATLLNVQAGTSLLFSQLLNFTDNERVCEYRDTYLDTSRYTLQRAW